MARAGGRSSRRLHRRGGPGTGRQGDARETNEQEPERTRDSSWQRLSRRQSSQRAVGRRNSQVSRNGVKSITTSDAEVCLRDSHAWCRHQTRSVRDHRVDWRRRHGRSAVDPSPGARAKVSKDGGNSPLWRRDGRELIFRSASGAPMAADITVTPTTFNTGGPRQLFATPAVPWGMTADGKRFLVSMPPPGSCPRQSRSP